MYIAFLILLSYYALKGYVSEATNPYVVAVLWLCVLALKRNICAPSTLRALILLAVVFGIMFALLNVLSTDALKIVKRMQFYFGTLLFAVLGYNIASSVGAKKGQENIRHDLIPSFVKLVIVWLSGVTLLEFMLTNAFGLSYETIYRREHGHFFNEFPHRALGLASNAAINNVLISVAYLAGVVACRGRLPKRYLILALLAFAASFSGSALLVGGTLLTFFICTSLKRAMFFGLTLVPFILLGMYVLAETDSSEIPFIVKIGPAYVQFVFEEFLLYLEKVFSQGAMRLLLGGGPLDPLEEGEDRGEDLSTTSDFGLLLLISEIGLVGLGVCLVLVVFFSKAIYAYVDQDKLKVLACIPYLLLAATLHYAVMFNVCVQVFSGLLWGMMLYVNKAELSSFLGGKERLLCLHNGKLGGPAPAPHPV